MSVNDPLPWIPKVASTSSAQAVAADRPVLGHCLGGQLMSKALGGRVRPNRVKEIGWLPVERTDAETGNPAGSNGLPAALRGVPLARRDLRHPGRCRAY
ncbi:MAG: hypothetical protein MZW92_46535 [Comamonadaceae bacterium]|nr:hypothetical protein [Comamonadaceae bacterium]